MVSLLIMMVLKVILFILMKFPEILTDFGAGDDFLGVDLVEYIDKRCMFGLDNTTNR